MRKSAIAGLCSTTAIKWLVFFNSVIRDDFDPENDVDVLVELRGTRVGCFILDGMEVEFSEMLGPGRRSISQTVLIFGSGKKCLADLGKVLASEVTTWDSGNALPCLSLFANE